MRAYKIIVVIVLVVLVYSCRRNNVNQENKQLTDTPDRTEVELDLDTPETEGRALPPTATIDTKNTSPAELVAFARTLIGTPYKYGSIKPQDGFDCSGFITHVFNHFGIAVPRSSVDFTNAGEEIPVAESRPGDLILFTGTDSTIRTVGHMGIIVSNSDSLHFIHSTSGKAYGVTITPLNTYYQGRFVKTIRVFR